MQSSNPINVSAMDLKKHSKQSNNYGSKTQSKNFNSYGSKNVVKNLISLSVMDLKKTHSK